VWTACFPHLAGRYSTSPSRWVVDHRALGLNSDSFKLILFKLCGHSVALWGWRCAEDRRLPELVRRSDRIFYRLMESIGEQYRFKPYIRRRTKLKIPNRLKESPILVRWRSACDNIIKKIPGVSWFTKTYRFIHGRGSSVYTYTHTHNLKVDLHLPF